MNAFINRTMVRPGGILFIIIFFMLCLPILFFGQSAGPNSKMSIAVVDFSIDSVIGNKDMGEDTANLLVNALNSIGTYSMKERLSLDKVLERAKARNVRDDSMRICGTDWKDAWG